MPMLRGGCSEVIGLFTRGTEGKPGRSPPLAAGEPLDTHAPLPREFQIDRRDSRLAFLDGRALLAEGFLEQLRRALSDPSVERPEGLVFAFALDRRPLPPAEHGDRMRW